MGRKGITTIQVYPETRGELIKLGAKNETYDEIIRKLIRVYRENSNSDE